MIPVTFDLVIPENKFIVVVRDCKIYNLYAGRLYSLNYTTGSLPFQHISTDKIYCFDNEEQIFQELTSGVCLNRYLLKETNKFETIKRLIVYGNYVGWTYLNRKFRVRFNYSDNSLKPYFQKDVDSTGKWCEEAPLSSGNFFYTNNEYDFWSWFTK